MKCKCTKCGRNTDGLYQLNSIRSLTEGYCKECIDRLNNKDMELLEAIKNGENLSKFLND